MVLFWRSWSLLCLLIVATAFAGCVAEEDPKPTGSDTDTAVDPGAVPTPSVGTKPLPSETKALTKVDSKSAVFAPSWNLGQSWTYDVSGTRPGEGYTVTIGVVDDSEDVYVLGADNGREFEQALIFRNSLMMGGVQKDSLAVLQGSEYQDLVGFKRAAGETWTVQLFGNAVSLTKIGVQTVSHGAGEAAGIRVEGAGDGQTFVLEYASDVEGISLFEWSDDKGTLLKYSLTGAAQSGTTGLVSWNVKAEHRTIASGGFTLVQTGFFESDGSGTHVLLVAEANAGTLGVGKVFDPEMKEAISIQDPEEGKTRVVVTVPDVAGEWRFLALSTSFLALLLYQVEIIQH